MRSAPLRSSGQVWLAFALPFVVGVGCSDETMSLPAGDAAIGRDATASVFDAGPRSDASTGADVGFAADAAAPEVCGGQTCAAGERCNAWTRQCQSLAIPYPPPGQDNGGTCMTGADCRSNGMELPNRPLCVTSNGADFCVSYCALPADFGVPDRFERSDCPAGSVCFAGSQFGDDMGIGTCVPDCDEDSDCRVADGYYCRKTIGGRTYASGYCAPNHCMSRGCTGYICGC